LVLHSTWVVLPIVVKTIVTIFRNISEALVKSVSFDIKKIMIVAALASTIGYATRGDINDSCNDDCKNRKDVLNV
jgi:type III secretory pathway component EscS